MLDNMENYIIIAIIAVLVLFGVRWSVKHFKGQSGCCVGGGYKAKKKHLKNIVEKKTFRIDGMKCENCKNRVEEIVNDIDGIAGNVDLKKGLLTVSYAKSVDTELIKSRIERTGYKLRDFGD